MKTIKLQFEGYWREVNKDSIPGSSGIYCVYRGHHDQNAKTVSLSEVLYIGESTNVKDRISTHDRYSSWKSKLKYGEILIFSYAPSNLDRIKAEAALIYSNKPPLNSEYVSSFPYETTELYTAGMNALLKSHSVVYKSSNNRYAY